MARDQGADEAREYEPGQPGMYELEFPAPQLSSSDGRGPVLVHALEGFSDAGHAIRLAAAHLKAALDTELVASFAIDELLDYRSRRPLMTFKTDHFTHSDDPELSLYALRDSIGTPFLLLAGLEPDLKWERFITAVRLLAERLGVRQTIGLGTVPMAVPHTRPITMTAHSNNRELISDFQPSISEIQVPGSASNLLEYRMAQHGHEVVGFTVHVPHYLTQTDYPAAAQALLEQVAKTGSLQLPLAVLIAGRIVGKAIGTTSLGHDLPNVLRILDDLPEPTASAAFGRTLRAVVDWRGQMVTMLDRCYLTEAIPVQIIWGTKDVVLPVRHAHMAHAAMPGSQLEIFEGSGHFPFHDDPARFIDIVERFMDTTEPAEYDQAALRALLRRGGGEATVTGSADTRVAVLNAIGSNERSAT